MPTDRGWILLAKKKSGEASPDELRELEEWLQGQDPATLETLDTIWLAPMQPVPETAPNRNVWHRIQKSAYAEEANRSYRGRMISMLRWSAAAVFLAAIAGGYIFLSQRHNDIAARPKGPVMNQVATQAGSKTRVELPDGTQVWLNGNSQITYGNKNFGVEEREVNLSGEAYFDVAKNEKVPFIIHTRDITIRVLGTAFNVRAYPKDRTVETSLIRGMVAITTRQDPERSIILKPAEKLIVPVDAVQEEQRRTTAAAQQPVSPYSIVKMKRDTAIATVWTRNNLAFDNETFEELAPKMEVWYNIHIHFADERIKRKRFTAVIEKESLVQTLDAMKLSAHFDYHITNDELWLREN